MTPVLDLDSDLLAHLDKETLIAIIQTFQRQVRQLHMMVAEQAAETQSLPTVVDCPS